MEHGLAERDVAEKRLIGRAWVEFGNRSFAGNPKKADSGFAVDLMGKRPRADNWDTILFVPERGHGVDAGRPSRR